MQELETGAFRNERTAGAEKAPRLGPKASPGSATARPLDRNHGSLHIGRRQERSWFAKGETVLWLARCAGSGWIWERFNRARRLRDAVAAWVPALVDETPPSAARETPKTFADLVKAVIPEHAREKPIELSIRKRSGTIGMKPGGA